MLAKCHSVASGGIQYEAPTQHQIMANDEEERYVCLTNPSPQSNSPLSRIRPPTPPLDPTIAALSSRLHVAKVSDASTSEKHLSTKDDNGIDDEEALSDDDALFAELERDDFDMGGMREKRLEALKAQMTKVKDLRETDHGRLTEVMDEKEVIRTSACVRLFATLFR